MSDLEKAMNQYGLDLDKQIKQFWIQEPSDPNKHHRSLIDTYGIYADCIMQLDGSKMWAVKCGSMVLSKSGEFCEDRFLNSSKTESYFKRFRFENIEDALKAVQKAISRNEKKRQEWSKMEEIANLIKNTAVNNG